MIDATRILDMLVGGQGAQGAFGEPPNQVPARYGDPQQQQHQPCSVPDLMERARGMLGGVTGALPGGFGGGMAGGVAAGAITSLLLGSKGGRAFAGQALKLGAAAALGGIAYRAYSNYRAGQPVGSRGSATTGANTASNSVPSVTPTPLPAATPANDHALLLVRAMIAAALADGTLDAQERQTIIGRLEAAGINPEELQFLDAEIARPWSPGQFAAAVPNPEQRAEIYLASAIAIDADTDAERTYLRYLAASLDLDDQLIAHLDDAVRGAQSGAASGSAPTPKALASG